MENLVFYKHETGVLFVEGFAEKFLASFQAQSCPRLFRTLPLTLLRQTPAYKYFQFFLKSCLQSLCVCNCRGTRVFNPSHCLPQGRTLFCGLPPKCFTNSPRLWATFCHLRRFSGTCCLEARAKSNEWKKVPYVRARDAVQQQRMDRTAWKRKLADLLQATDAQLIHLLREDRLLHDWTGKTCPRCEKGTFSKPQLMLGTGMP